MRQRYVLVFTWLAATLVATSVGVFATYSVGEVIRGVGPLGRTVEAGTRSQTEGEGSARPSRRSFSYPPADLVVECVGRKARILDLNVDDAWDLIERENGPDEDVDFRIERGDGFLVVEIYCNEGVPRPVVEYEEPTDAEVEPNRKSDSEEAPGTGGAITPRETASPPVLGPAAPPPPRLVPDDDPDDDGSDRDDSDDSDD